MDAKTGASHKQVPDLDMVRLSSKRSLTDDSLPEEMKRRRKNDRKLQIEGLSRKLDNDTTIKYHREDTEKDAANAYIVLRQTRPHTRNACDARGSG